MDASSRPARAVLRIAKVKADGLDRLSRHDTRATPPANDDPAKGGTVWLTEATDPAAAVRAELATHDKPPRKGATVAVQAIITARAEWFGEGSTRKERAEAFTAHAMAWAKASLPGKVVAAVRHDGEAAPHLHVWIVPVVETETAVNRRRPELGRRPCRRLDYRSLYGGGRAEARDKMVALQDGIGKALAPLGIERGVSRTVSQAEHRTAWQWRAEQARATEEACRLAAAAAAEAEKAAAAQLELAKAVKQHLEAAARHETEAREDRLKAIARHEAEAKESRRKAAAEQAAFDKGKAELARSLASAAQAEQAAAEHLARMAAIQAGQDALDKGEILDAKGPPGQLEPVFADGVPKARREEIEKAIQPDRQGVLAWVAAQAAWLRGIMERKVQELMRLIDPMIAIQTASAKAERIVANAGRAKARQRPPRELDGLER
ncbi:MAG TPA: hypothetical protein HPQ04_01005 [Rhodospirillaceae bacterium]|nr:hypothetical protein [Rhodospirillaceae bacterium]